MVKKSNVEKAAATWRLLDSRARKMLDGDEKDRAIKARNNALRTLGKAVDAAESLDAWTAKQALQKQQPER